MQKFLSRKFITAATVIAAGLVMVFSDLNQGEANDLMVKAVGGIMALLAGLGYNIAEAKVDAARADADKKALGE